jgi:linoleoyl-CoA desaturase
MKTIKFIGENSVEKQFVSALRKNVNDYFKQKGISVKGNYTMYIKSVVMLSLYLAPFVILLTIPTATWIAVVLVIIMGIGEAGIGMSVMHDASHNAFSYNKKVNEFFSSTIFLLGSNTFNWKIQHTILHHTYTNIFGYDPDIDTKAVIRLSEHAPHKSYHRYQFVFAYFLYGLMTLFKLMGDISQLIDFNRKGITRELGRSPGLEMFKLLLTKVIYISLIIGLPLWLTEYKWWQVIIGFCILHLTAGIIMSTVFQMAHVVEGARQPLPDSNSIIHHEWIVHELMTTSDFARSNHFLNWYIGGLNFQIEHHLFPNICHIHYRKIAPIVEKTAHEFGFEYNLKPSFTAAFLSHARRLKELGKSIA